MVETAAALARRRTQDHRADRRDDSVCVRELGRPVQPRKRALVRAGPAAGVYMAMNGTAFPWNRVRKNRETGMFEGTAGTTDTGRSAERALPNGDACVPRPDTPFQPSCRGPSRLRDVI